MLFDESAARCGAGGGALCAQSAPPSASSIALAAAAARIECVLSARSSWRRSSSSAAEDAQNASGASREYRYGGTRAGAARGALGLGTRDGAYEFYKLLNIDDFLAAWNGDCFHSSVFKSLKGGPQAFDTVQFLRDALGKHILTFLKKSTKRLFKIKVAS
jgi:hypothetical protein